MTTNVWISCMALVAALGATSAWGVESELMLTTGETVHGVIVSQTEDVVVVERSIASKKGPITAKVTYLRSKILKIVELAAAQDPLFEYMKKAKGTGTDPESQLALAGWCQERGLVNEAIFHLDAVIKAKPNHPEALKRLAELGAMEVDGTWVSEQAHLADSEMVREGGRVVDSEEKGQGRERSNVIVRANQLEQKLAQRQKAFALTKVRYNELPILIQTARSTSESADYAVTTAKQNEEASRVRSKEIWRDMNEAKRNGNDDSNHWYRDRCQEADRDTVRYQKERTDALAKKAGADKEVAKLTRELATLEERIGAIETELADLEAETTLAVQARTEANEAAKAAKAQEP